MVKIAKLREQLTRANKTLETLGYGAMGEVYDCHVQDQLNIAKGIIKRLKKEKSK
jgi:hypothetical protein